MLLVVVPQSLFITQSYGRTRGQGEGRIEDRKTRESHESCTSSQVKSSQVKFKMAVANPPPLVPLAGASDREGRTRRNRHHCG